MSGAAFDRGYMQQMVTDHQEALKMLQGAAKQAKDSDVKSAAQKKAPVVEEHLKMARETLASLRGDGKAKQGEKK
jgi:putative membrane protein